MNTLPSTLRINFKYDEYGLCIGIKVKDTKAAVYSIIEAGEATWISKKHEFSGIGSEALNTQIESIKTYFVVTFSKLWKLGDVTAQMLTDSYSADFKKTLSNPKTQLKKEEVQRAIPNLRPGVVKRQPKLRVRFVLRKSRMNSMGQCPLDVRIRLNGIQAVPFSTHMMVLPAEWDSKYQVIIEDQIRTKQLKAIREGIQALYNRFRGAGKNPTAQDISDYYRNSELEFNKRWTMTELIVVALNKLRERGRASATLSSYKHTYELFAQTSQIAHVEDVRRVDVSNFWYYLISLGLSKNYANKQTQRLYGLFDVAIANEIIEHNPAKALRLEWEDTTDTTSLDEQEIERLFTTEWSATLQKVVDSWLFMAFTGLHIADYIKLNSANRKSQYGSEWIEYTRQKSRKPAIVPLHPVAQRLIEKYGSIEKLPRISGQKQNEFLSVIAAKIETDKKLTNKTARKTFTDMSINHRNMSTESVAAMLGHASTKWVKVYGSVKHQRIFAEWKA